MIFSAMGSLLSVRVFEVPPDCATDAASAQLELLLLTISSPYARREAAEHLKRGDRARLILRRRRRARLLAVGGLPGDPDARGRSRRGTDRSRSRRRPAARRRGRARP